MERLDDLRLKIDLIDNDLINLLKKRIDIVKKIKQYKMFEKSNIFFANCLSNFDLFFI